MQCETRTTATSAVQAARRGPALEPALFCSTAKWVLDDGHWSCTASVSNCGPMTKVWIDNNNHTRPFNTFYFSNDWNESDFRGWELSIRPWCWWRGSQQRDKTVIQHNCQVLSTLSVKNIYIKHFYSYNILFYLDVLLLTSWCLIAAENRGK